MQALNDLACIFGGYYTNRFYPELIIMSLEIFVKNNSLVIYFTQTMDLNPTHYDMKKEVVCPRRLIKATFTRTVN